VTDSHQQSYYELALTNRQVMVAFVVLLACIFIAFFSGIWIGRQDNSQQVLEASQQTVEAAADALDLGTLQFFSDSADESKAKPAKAEPLKAEKSGTTLLEDVRGEEAKEEAASASPPAPQPSEEPRIEPVTTPPAATEAIATKPPAAPVPTAGQLVIQVFSAADQTQAQGLKDRLTTAGLAAFISPVEVGGRMMHRVRIGPFDDKAEASAVADRVRRDFKLDTWITHN